MGDADAIGDTREVDEEGLIGLEGGVAVDGNGDGLGIDASREVEGAAGRKIIGACGGGAVGGGISDTEGGRAAGAGDGEGGDLAAAIAFGDCYIADGDRTGRLRIVVEDGADGLRIGDADAIGDTREVDEEGLIGLEGGVAVDGNGDGLGIDASREVEGAASRKIIGACRGGAVGGGISDTEGGRAAGAGDGVDGDLAAAVAFGDCYIADGDRADGLRIVVDNGGERLSVDDGGAAGCPREIDEEGL